MTTTALPRLQLVPSALALLLLAGLAAPQDRVESTATAPFPNFESGATRPMLLDSTGQRLLVLNTPDGRLESYATGLEPGGAGPGQLTYLGSVFTGLEPVAMARHPVASDLVFVANVVSDTVAVVDTARMQVLATVEVGDEPQDLEVLGDRVFVATARSNEPTDLVDPGAFVDNAVVVLSADAPWEVLQRIDIGAHKPRALATLPGAVHVIPQNSGNHTTILDVLDTQALDMGQLDPDAFDPPVIEHNETFTAPGLNQGGFNNNPFGVNGWTLPPTSRIVMDDEYPGLTPQLPDHDVVTLDAATGAITGTTTGVGTTLLAIEVDPSSGALWVAGTDASNRTRFEPTITGAAMDNRVTIVGTDGEVSSILSLGPPLTTREHAQPASIAFHQAPRGGPTWAYVGALGTGTVVVLDAASGALVDELDVGLLPLGLAVDSARGLLYVFTRIDSSVRVYDILAGHAPVGRATRLACDPEPQGVTVGRRHLYDARAETAHGSDNFSCASCHVFGHVDALAWDLGNPEGGMGYFYPDLMTGEVSFDNQKIAQKKSSMIHPMKGPMTTQSLRGLGDAEAVPLHWRGDRRFFQHFRGAFVGLLGGAGISGEEMQEFTTFVRSMTYAPNPFQPKDRVYTGAAANGFQLYGLDPNVNGKEYNALIPGNVTCVDCHQADFVGESDFTGAQPTVNFDAEPQMFNTPQLRALYEKEFRHLTGFGTLHDGSLDGVEAFMDVDLMGMQGFPLLSPQDRDDIEALIEQWDTGLAPLVGSQRTVSADSAPADLDAWLALAEAQAAPPISDVDLVAKVTIFGGTNTQETIGLHYQPDPVPGDGVAGVWLSDTGRLFDTGTLTAALDAGAADAVFTVVPPGTGRRLGIDRDEDGLLDGVERALGTDPGRPDTDADGWDDALEVAAGSSPKIPGFTGVDGDAPVVESVAALDVHHVTATLAIVTSEPAGLEIDLGTSAGAADLGTVTDASLRRAHDVIVSGLAAGSEIHYTVRATDRSGNVGTSAGSFTTAAPECRVADIGLVSDGLDPVTLTATVTVVDQDGNPVPGTAVRGLWAGDLGGADFFPIVDADANGIATFTLGPYTPAPGSTITFSVGYVGTNDDAHPFFVGFGGDDAAFFYAQFDNAVNFQRLTLP